MHSNAECFRVLDSIARSAIINRARERLIDVNDQRRIHREINLS